MVGFCCAEESNTGQASPRTPTQRTCQPQEAVQPQRNQTILQPDTPVLVSSISGGLPPERFDAEGNPIKHTIEVDPDAVPFKHWPWPFSTEEDAEIQRYLQHFLAKGWVVPSLSPWAAPVLFVPKKVDPVTDKRTWRMCISFVKLNSKTLNRIGTDSHVSRICLSASMVRVILVSLTCLMAITKFACVHQICQRPRSPLLMVILNSKLCNGTVWCTINVSILDGQYFFQRHTLE